MFSLFRRYQILIQILPRSAYACSRAYVNIYDVNLAPTTWGASIMTPAKTCHSGQCSWRNERRLGRHFSDSKD